MKTNDLRYTKTKTCVNIYGEKCDIIVKIRLNDECNNGHQDFSITGDTYKAGKRGDKNHLSGGCIHEEIIKHFPKFKIFVDLHLCDAKGIPMHAGANGFYFLKNGFSSKSTGEDFKKEYCEYYRMTPEQFDIIKDSENQLEFTILLNDLGILKQWHEQAQQAIKLLENLTGDEFINDSKKSQYHTPKEEDIQKFRELKQDGFYSQENKKKRAKVVRKLEREKRFAKIQELCNEKIEKEKEDTFVKLFVLKRIEQLASKKTNVENGFTLNYSFEDFIYYSHNKTVQFNWRKSSFYKEMSSDEFKMFCDSITESDFKKLPDGIVFACKGSTFKNLKN